MFNVGMIGCGIIGWAHIEAFKTIDDAKITAVCDISDEHLKDAIGETGANGYKDYKEMLEKEELDLVVINLPHGLHGEATCYCAEKGVNVFLEKPMGISSGDCEKMISACEKAGVMLWVGHPQRYVAGNIFAKSLIDSGELGELVSFMEIRNVDYFSEKRPRWFLNKAMSGGGIMINLGAHSLDKMKFFSDSTIEEISGSIHLREDSDCEDGGQAFVKMANGVTGVLNLVGHTGASHILNSLYLTRGEIRINLDNTVDYCGADGEFKKHECESISVITKEMQDVIRVMRGDKKPAVDGAYGLEIIHAIKRLYGEEA